MPPELKEILRIKKIEIINSKFESLEGMLIGKDIINNPNIIRKDDIITGDIVFYKNIEAQK